MAINDPAYRYATQTWEADGVRTDYEIAFDGGYIRQSDVVAYSLLLDADTGLTTDRTPHALEFITEDVDPETEWKSATVRIEPAIPLGRRVVIYRSTEKSQALVNYTAGSVITKKNLDLANDQSTFGIAEIMDGLNAAQINIDEQVQEVIDINLLINQIYQLVLDMLASGGIVSVTPRVWAGVGDGVTTDFLIAGADVDGAGFYDTYVNGAGIQPDADYGIDVTGDPTETLLRFEVAPADGAVWFTVLRGYAKPYTGPPPITDLDLKVIDVEGEVHFVDGAAKYGLLRCLHIDGCTVTVNAINPVDPLRMKTGSYFSILQRNTNASTLVPDPGVEFLIPGGYLAETRAYGSVISATCEDADTNLWVISGDLAKE